MLIEVCRAGRRVFLTINIPIIALSSHYLKLKGTSNIHLVQIFILQELWHNIPKLIYDTIRFLKYLEACGANGVVAGIIEQILAPVIYRAFRERVLLLDWKF